MLVLLLISAVFSTEFTTVKGVINAGRTHDDWKSRVIYQVLTDRFQRSDGSNSSCNYGSYCGGTYRGLINKLDYIKNLGMNAIWISPIVENTGNGYHGYHAKNFYSLNSNFGSESDFKEFVSACHSRDIWVMVDVVFNHVGDVDTDYGQIYPFNQGWHYHDKCQITNYADQANVEYCRVANLPDLNTENEYVKSELKSWLQWVVNTYDVDGIRIDTVKHVNINFWKELVEANKNLYMVGEVFDGSVSYLKTYTDVMRAQLSYPMYYTIINVYKWHQSCYQIRSRLQEYAGANIDNTVMGGFIDNHDNKRWLNENGDWTALKNALAFLLLHDAIPIVYYGTEQGYSGGDDPNNREPLWYSGFNENHELYKFIQTAAKLRQSIAASNTAVERYCDDQFFSWSRGEVLVCTTSTGGSLSRTVTYLPFSAGTNVRELYSGKTATVSSSGLPINIENGMPQIWVKN